MGGILGGGKSNAQKPTKYYSLNIQTSVAGLAIPILWGQNKIGGNVIWTGGFLAIAQKSGKGGKGGGGKGGAASYKYYSDFIIGLCEGEIQGITYVWANDTLTPWASSGLGLMTGGRSQPPLSGMVALFPSQAEAYAGTAYVFSSEYPLGSSPQIPNFSYEAAGVLAWSESPAHGVPDANPADIVHDYLTNTYYGLDPLRAPTYIDATSLSQYNTYCKAQCLLFSPYLSTQEQGTQTLQRWAQLSNTWIFWNGTTIKFVPLGDEAITAYGTTYTPNNNVAYNLNADDYVITNQDEPPIKVTRSSPYDGYNRVQIDFRDRSRAYESNPLEWEDAASIDQYGPLQSLTVTADEVCDPNIASFIVSLLGPRTTYLRNSYEFTLPYTFLLLEPGDLLTLTEVNLGLALFPVRITEVGEDEKGYLKIKAEECPGNLGIVGELPVQSGIWNTPPGANTDPGDVNTPVIFEPPVSITGGVPQIWIGASGGPAWGGCYIYASADGTNYFSLGQIDEKTIQGVLTADLADHADPDTANTLHADTAQSAVAVPPAITHADADAGRAILLVDSEVIGFGTVASTGTFTSDLSYLRRGQLNTSHASHASGEQFSVIDPTAMFHYTYPAQYKGQTLYFKFVSFNIFGSGTQDISAVTAYSYTIAGTAYTIAPPTAPSGSVSRITQADGTTLLGVTLSWSASVGPSLGSYEVQWSTDGGTTWTVDTNVGANATSSTFTPATASTTYIGRVRAISENGQAVSTWATATGVSTGSLVSSVPSAPTGLAAVALPAAAALSWTASTDPTILSYTVFRAAGLGASFGSAVQIATSSAPATAFTDSTAAGSAAYTYFLEATNAAGSSSASAGASVTTLAAAVAGSYAGSLTATGAGQSGAYAITANVSVFTTVASGSGARLPASPTAGDTYRIVNRGANDLAVYPASGGQIEGFGANAASLIAPGASATYIAESATQWLAT